ncbi:unnamed protein product [Paramecium sonneborni]|uniref:Carboxypeptidase n=1 Tax=Paramecium sonneborni TaxID=65129 RepID=A0A8S1MWR1_9CILI|nr:unnamed protein product [Paramecium sonneborni]
MIQILILTIVHINGLQMEDKVSYLPPFNMSDQNFSIFSGYLSITNNNQSFHYVFVQSQLNNLDINVPLVLWLNGGPGCSSMIGFLQEIGPFVFMNEDDESLQFNEYSWNRVAHLLFLESPSGVGFSHNPLNITFNDQQTADDNLKIIQEFYSSYPEYQKNPLWLAGESYGGAYIPLLAEKIKKFNDLEVAVINLKGMMIGNGVTNLTHLPISQLIYQKEHQLLPPTFDITGCEKNVTSEECENINYDAWKITKRINPYDIYGYCYYEENEMEDELQWIQQMKQFMMIHNNNIVNVTNHDLGVPCVQIDNIQNYLNDVKIKRYLHVDENIEWFMCTKQQNKQFKYVSDPPIVMKVLQELLDFNIYTILLYNGDADSVVPWIDTLRSLQKLNVSITEEWRPYYVKNNQLGGYTQGYLNKLRFVTVRGAGHMVPQNDRITAFYLFNQTLNEETF